MLPEITNFANERGRATRIKNRAEIKISEELQKGSEILRKEASSNLQKYGGNYMPDFYGGKARMNFTLNNASNNQVLFHKRAKNSIKHNF